MNNNQDEARNGLIEENTLKKILFFGLMRRGLLDGCTRST